MDAMPDPATLPVLANGSTGQAGDTHRPRVLVIDDDPLLRSLCVAVLEPVYRVVVAEDGLQGLRALYMHRPDIVLLDVSMPGIDGVETCRRIRDLTDTPIIMLTARGADHDVVRGLDAGADDYIVKPFRPAQLLARMRAVLRRHTRQLEASPEVLSFDGGRLIVDTRRRLVVVRGKEVALSATEYRLLEFLARHPGQVLSHDQILEHVWGPAYAGEHGYVKTYIGLLRSKIEEDPHNPAYILARRGLGYYLERRGRQMPAAEP